MVCSIKDQIDQTSVTLELPGGEQLVLSRDFIEWFRGFTDGEGSFIITGGKGNVFSFNFIIGLHIDDKGALEYIHNTLRLGKVTVNLVSGVARFTVRTQREIAVIIAIFSKYNLNTHKHLNFLAFERAYWLYMENNSLEARKELKPVIEGIISGMNSKRTDFNLPRTHYKITANWLLGFVEADGWFSFSINERSFSFGIIQKDSKALFEAIQGFLHLALQTELGSESVANIYQNKAGLYFMVIKRVKIIEEVVIPIFDDLTWHTKKYMDYCDWKTILNLRINKWIIIGYPLPSTLELTEPYCWLI